MASIFILGGVLSVLLVVALVVAAIADRRRSISVDSDGSRFEPRALNPKLPWA